MVFLRHIGGCESEPMVYSLMSTCRAGGPKHACLLRVVGISISYTTALLLLILEGTNPDSAI